MAVKARGGRARSIGPGGVVPQEPCLNLSSVIIYGHPDAQPGLRERLASLPGVEVHAAAPDGRLVATIECDDDHTSMQTYQAIERSAGVLSVALVYRFSEPEAGGGNV